MRGYDVSSKNETFKIVNINPVGDDYLQAVAVDENTGRIFGAGSTYDGEVQRRGALHAIAVNEAGDTLWEFAELGRDPLTGDFNTGGSGTFNAIAFDETTGLLLLVGSCSGCLQEGCTVELVRETSLVIMTVVAFNASAGELVWQRQVRIWCRSGQA
ncbi:unnamed protein product [Pylaiella littoralis]